ncbi:uncharacterized protein PAC_07762 [Phialocephala subalpina]|uniref:Uncharacterized protein n=1 Tax=Phialocephala subalpina TaxID=576137 RepID=A0A1L7WYN0_9HELO|nr:uncharacterized protein PAC_07762 [Phialocephala subalpina]
MSQYVPPLIDSVNIDDGQSIIIINTTNGIRIATITENGVTRQLTDAEAAAHLKRMALLIGGFGSEVPFNTGVQSGSHDRPPGPSSSGSPPGSGPYQVISGKIPLAAILQASNIGSPGPPGQRFSVISGRSPRHGSHSGRPGKSSYSGGVISGNKNRPSKKDEGTGKR